MANINKYRVHEVAKDFGLPTKDIVEILTKYAQAPKNHMQVLEDAGVYKRTEAGREGFERFMNSPDVPPTKIPSTPFAKRNLVSFEYS